MPQMDISKEVRYLNKDFVTFRNALINFAKVYFPNSYKDFNESSIGMMFMEMSSYIGDVLSFYLDSNLKESILLYAEENKNVLYLAQSLGYKNKTTVPAFTTIDVFQQIPATGANGENPDFKFALKLGANAQIPPNSFSFITHFVGMLSVRLLSISRSIWFVLNSPFTIRPIS